jgi:hypothetical protein
MRHAVTWPAATLLRPTVVSAESDPRELLRAGVANGGCDGASRAGILS